MTGAVNGVSQQTRLAPLLYAFFPEELSVEDRQAIQPHIPSPGVNEWQKLHY
jgi:hypothetical protein